MVEVHYIVFEGLVWSSLLMKFIRTRTGTGLGPDQMHTGPDQDCGPGPNAVLMRSWTSPNQSWTKNGPDWSVTGSDQSSHDTMHIHMYCCIYSTRYTETSE
jgi:hypothetical protein